MELLIGTILPFAGPIFHKDERDEYKEVDDELFETGCNNAQYLANNGCLPCNGRKISRSNQQLKELYNVILYIWGSENVGNFYRIPDMRGLFLRGVSGNSGRDTGGQRISLYSGGASGNMVGSYQNEHLFEYNAAKGSPHQSTHAADHHPGVGIAYLHNHAGIENRPKNVYVNYIIKASSEKIDLDNLYHDEE